MMKKIMMKVGDNRGMTLIEVTVALVLFVSVFTILAYGMSGALKVMNNANQVQNATESNTNGLNTIYEQLKKQDKTGLTPVTGLTNSITLKLANGTTSYTIPGSFYDYDYKTNDRSLALFDAFSSAALQQPTLPVPGITSEKNVSVPTSTKVAYFSPDKTISKELFTPAGIIQTWNFGSWSNTYDNTYGKLHIGVTTQQFIISGHDINDDNEYLQELFFVNSTPFLFSGSGEDGIINYNILFMYIGEGDDSNDSNPVKITVNTVYNSPTEFRSANKLTLNGYKGASNVILYLKNGLQLTTSVTCYNDKNNSPAPQTKILPAGYYIIPSGTDILKAAYDDLTYTTFVNSYKTTYSVVSSQLIEMGIVFTD